jgi:hypothetical protein
MGTLPVEYDREVYTVEKLMGVRTKTGMMPVKRLTARHRQIISLHLQGYSNNTIASLLDLSAVNVCHILQDPKVKDILEQFHQSWMQELESLGGLAVDAVRGALLSEDHNISLKAADKYFRTQKMYTNEQEATKETAEDVISRALEVMGTQADTIREVARSSRANRIIDTTSRDITNGSDITGVSKDSPRNNESDMGKCDGE